MIEIILATANLHKIREFREMFKCLPHFELLSLVQFPHYKAPEETGKTFQENALLKAEHAAKTLSKLVLADDSGLVVPALGGAPGIFSSRYAGENATDAENRSKLLDAMRQIPENERVAYFECSLALAKPEGLVKSVTASCEGLIGCAPRGSSGFGYDPLFIKGDYDKTFGELGDDIKNRISHRRKAFEKLLVTLETMR